MTRLPSALFTPVVAIALGVLAACISTPRARFSHATHLAEQQCGGPGQPECMSCGTCHVPGPRTTDMSLPQPELCAACHAEPSTRALAQRPKSAASDFAHTIRFSHERHLAMPEVKGQCMPCHAGAAGDGKQVRAFPPMQQCFGCHEHAEQWKRSECAPCHERGDYEDVLPSTFLRHDSGFLRQHGALTETNRATCAQCHTQSECDDCHDVTQTLRVEHRAPERLEQNFVHRADYLSRHSIEARADSASCMRCHSTQSCEDCHLERGVSANHRAALNPHPPGWVGSFTQGRSFHGAAARRDIVACASCHDQGPLTNCIACHKVGGFGGNPHPNGWRSARSPDDFMCRYCHEP